MKKMPTERRDEHSDELHEKGMIYHTLGMIRDHSTVRHPSCRLSFRTRRKRLVGIIRLTDVAMKINKSYTQ